MTAVLNYARSSLTLTDRDPTPCGPGEVAIEVHYTGICGTDLHIFHGDMDARVPDPLVPGHEMSGRISELGEGVDGWSVGQPVTVLPTRSCGTCPACVAGQAHICHLLVFLGIDDHGSMQSRWVVPADNLVALPDDLELQHAALVEPLAVAVHDVRRSGLGAGERVLVVGGGPVGVLIALVARNEGADVVLSEMDAGRRARAEELGLRTLDPASVDVPAEVTTWTEGAGADVAFEVSGAPRGVDAAIQSLAVRGRLVMVAIHPKPCEVDLFRFFWRELQLIGARLYDRSDFERAVELASSGAVPVAALISDVVTLDRAEQAYRALESGQGMKILVDCQRSGA